MNSLHSRLSSIGDPATNGMLKSSNSLITASSLSAAIVQLSLKATVERTSWMSNFTWDGSVSPPVYSDFSRGS